MAKVKYIDFERFTEALNYLRGKGKAQAQEEIVEKTGLSKSVISEYLNNKKPLSENFVRQFATAYDLNIDYLLYGIGTLTGDPPPSLNGSKEKILEDLQRSLVRLDAMTEKISVLETDIALLKKIVLKQE